MLPIVAKQRSLFNDPAQEIEQLTYVVKTDITTLNGEIDLLQEFLQSNIEVNQTKHSTSHSKVIIDNLKGKLANTTKSFTDILELRTKVQRDITWVICWLVWWNGGSRSIRTINTANRIWKINQWEGKNMAQLIKRSTPDSVLFSASFSRSFLLSVVVCLDLIPAHVMICHSSDPFEETKDEELGGGMAQEHDQLLAPVEQDQNFLESRAAAVQHISETIHQIGKIYERFANIVAIQNDVVIRFVWAGSQVWCGVWCVVCGVCTVPHLPLCVDVAHHVGLDPMLKMLNRTSKRVKMSY